MFGGILKDSVNFMVLQLAGFIGGGLSWAGWDKDCTGLLYKVSFAKIMHSK